MPFFTSLRQTLPAAILLINLSYAQTCYYPDSSVSTDIPCDSTAPDSSCCGSNSFCLSDGLCLNGNIVTRASCTDNTWASEACATQCLVVDRNAEVAITPCTSGDKTNTFVCGVNTTDCQSDSNTFTMSSDTGLLLRPSQIAVLVGSALATSTSSSIASAGASKTACASASSAGLYTSGQMAGVGCGVGLPLCIALVVVILLLRKEKRNPAEMNLMYKLPDETKSGVSFQAPPPAGQKFAQAKDRLSHVSHVSGATQNTASRRASMRMMGTQSQTWSPTPIQSQTFSEFSHSQSFLERYEAMKRNASAQSVETNRTATPYELESPFPHELSGTRMSK